MKRFLCALILLPALAAQTTRYPGALDDDSSLFVVQDNLQTSLNAAMGTGDTAMVVADGTRFAANQIVTVCDTKTSSGKCTAWEHMLVTAVSGNILQVTRAFAGTTARTHTAGKLVSVLIDSAHQKVLKDSVVAIETALGPNLANVGGGGGAFPSGKYLFSPYSCNGSAVCTPGGASGGTLSPGNNVLTLQPVPGGMNGTDTGHLVYISGGTGTPETCVITGGSGSSGQSSGQILIQCANAHSGAWTMQSATAGVQEAWNAMPSGGTVAVTPGTNTFYGAFTAGQPGALMGSPGSVILAAANAGLQSLVIVPVAVSGFVADGVVFDGNRAANGTAQNSGSNAYALIRIGGSHTRIRDCELRLGQATGIFVGDLTNDVSDVTISGNYFHDIGGAINSSGWGTGIYLGASSATNPITRGVMIANNSFYEIHNIVSGPGPSACINAATAREIQVVGNHCQNAYNVTGGMIVAGTSASPSCAGLSQNWLISGNTVVRTGSFGGDSTSGVEVCTTGVTVTGNTITSMNQGGIIIGASSANIAVSGNFVLNSGSLVTVGGSAAGGSATDVTITGNRGTGGLYGILLNYTGVDYITVANNDVTGNTTPLWDASTAAHVFIRDNLGYNPLANGTGAITVGGSPFTYTAGHSPESIAITGGNVTAVKVNSANMCTNDPCFIMLAPNQAVTVTYTSTPAMVKTIL